MGNSTYSREWKAQRELDKAWERLLANADICDEIASLLISNGIIKGDQIFREATNLTINGKKFDTSNHATANMVLSAYSDFLQKKNGNTIIVGTMVDGGMLVLSKLVPGVGQLSLALDVFNLLDKMTFDTGILDLRKQMQNLYDRLQGTTSDLPDLEMLKKGILQITMHDGTVYARPLIDTGSKFSLFGNNKSDVLFGGNGNDTLMGKNGNDILLGGNGFDTYNATNGDTIKDSDGKGSVYFNGHKLTGGTYDKDKGVCLYLRFANLNLLVA